MIINTNCKDYPWPKIWHKTDKRWLDFDEFIEYYFKNPLLYNSIEVVPCSGLRDEDGNMLYHGDYLVCDETLYILEWQPERAKFELLYYIGNGEFELDGGLDDALGFKYDGYLNGFYEIGNKYENPEKASGENDYKEEDYKED